MGHLGPSEGPFPLLSARHSNGLFSLTCCCPLFPLRFLFSSAVSASPAIGAACPLSIRALTFDFSGSLFEGSGDEEGSGDGPSAVSVASVDLEEEEEPQCPPGLRQYETVAVLRPDMIENELLALIQQYEELLVAGGGMCVVVVNRGVIPQAYSIRKKNKAGETNTYFDGIYLLFVH